MKNHIIFWNRGKAITLALLAPLALSLHGYAVDEYGDLENKNNSDPAHKSEPVYYAWTRDEDGRIGYEEVGEAEVHDFIWYRNHTREEKSKYDSVSNPTGDIVGNYRELESDYTAVYNNRSTIESITGDFEKNVNTKASSGHGGAIYNREGAIIDSIQGYFVENSTPYEGGAIGNFKSSINLIQNSLFLGNKAQGADGGGAICNYDNYIGEIVNSTFIGNQATSRDTTKKTGKGIGGAIRNRNGATIDKISGANFYANYATKSGGAIYNDANSLINEISALDNDGNVFKWNWAEESGGAIHNEGIIGSSADNEGGPTIVTGIVDAEFQSNRAKKVGGAIYNKGTIYTIKGGKFDSNEAEADGGAIYNTITKDGNGNITGVGTIGDIGLNADDATAVAFKGNRAGGYGGAIYNAGQMGNIIASFTENSSINHGGAIYNKSGSTISSIIGQEGVEGSGVFEGNQSKGKAGAICNEGTIGSWNVEADGSVTLIGGIVGAKFTNNVGSGGAGAVYNGDSISHIYNTTFEGNNSQWTSLDSEGNPLNGGSGGAIQNGAIIGAGITDADGSVTVVGGIENTTFKGNRARQAGAIQNTGTIGAISNSVFVENDSLGKENSEGVLVGGGNAGAIYNNNGKIGHITADFENNKAGSNGGAINNYTADSIIGDIGLNANNANAVGFKGNQAGGTGGAIYNRGQIGALLTFFTDNTSGSDGGAIYNTIITKDGVVTGVGTIGDIGLNANNATAVAFKGNQAGGIGGAIYNAGLVGNIIASFTDNTASKGGGAIYNSGSIAGISKSTFSSNDSSWTTIKEDGKAADGGVGAAIYNTGLIGVSDGDMVYGGIYDTEFSGNTTTSSAGAVYNKGTIGELDHVSFLRNQSRAKESEGKLIGGGDGGALYNEGKVGNIIASFTDNSATGNGGAVYNKANSTIGDIKGVEIKEELHGFKGNTTGSSGGAIYNAGQVGNIVTNFTDNTATGKGGAIYNTGTIGYIAENVKFTYNKASDDGGAIYNSGTIAGISESTFSSNDSSWTTIKEDGKAADGGVGAALYNSGIIGVEIKNDREEVTVIGGIYDTEFSGNTTTSSAGAVYNKGTIGELHNVRFSDNKSQAKESEGKLIGGGEGGALYNDGSIALITKGIFESNLSEKSGGAIYNHDSSSTPTGTKIGAIISTDFSGNESKSSGGAITNWNAAIGTIEKSTFSGNKASSQGGALYNSGTIGSWVDKGDSTAEIFGGIEDVDFTENKSTNDGGAIYNTGKISHIAGGKYEKNDSQWTEFTVVVTYKDDTIKPDTYEFTYTEGKEFNETIRPEHAVKDTKLSYNGGSGAALYNSGTIGEEIADADGDAPKVKGGITEAVFKDNITSHHNGGGAIYNAGIIGDITDTEFVNNSSQGREIYMDASVMLDGERLPIEKPLDGGMGGAIMNVGTIYTITGGTFEGNKAGTGGGAICNGDGKNGVGYIREIEIDTIRDNWADFASLGGGAILNRKGSKIGSITVNNLIGNTVGLPDQRTTSGGGGIANYGVIENVDIKEASGNRTWRHNGGVILNATEYHDYVVESRIGIISGEHFHDNFAFGSGGAIHNEGEGAVIQAIEVELFENNISTSSGGAVRNYRKAEIESDELNSNFKGNYATNRGGALFFEGTLDKGIFNASYEKNASGNDGGAIVLAEATSVIGNIDNTVFTENRAGIWRERPENDDWKTIAEWKENPTQNSPISNGGAILNGFRYVDVNIDDDTGEQLKLSEWLANRKADGELEDMGSEYYIFKSEGSRIGSISQSVFKSNTAGYTLSDKAAPVGEEVLASGGAIANGFIDHYQSPDNTVDQYDFWLVAGGRIDLITETAFKMNKALYRGGAIYNVHGTIGDIEHSEFTDNKALRQEGSGDGGAIFNNQSATIGHIRNTTFTSNEAGGSGGAIYNELAGNTASAFPVALGASGSIGDILSSAFSENTAGQDGGGIYNLGVIGEIKAEFNVDKGEYVGGFASNTAGTKSAEGAGGGVYNGEAGTIEGFWNTDFTANSASALGTAFTNIGRTGKIEDNQTKTREYDNTVVAGLTNTSFTDNTSNEPQKPYGERIAALYTETDLAIIAKDNATVKFSDNVVGKFTDDVDKESDIFVGAKNGETPDMYMIAEQGSKIHTRGEIDGDAGYALRLRGSLKQGADIRETRGGGNNTGGTVHFDGLVKKADVIMDDVTLIIGHDAKNHRAIDTTKDYVAVYDDSLKHNDHGNLLYPEEVDFTGAGGDVDSHLDNKRRLYSDVLRNSRLEARSGRVMTADDDIVNYNIGAIVANGRKSYLYGQGYYNTGNYADAGEDANKDLYATWSININFDTCKADTFTTWYKEGDEMAQSHGYMTLSGCRIDAKESSTNKEEDWVTWRDKTSDGPWEPDWKTEAGLEDFEHHDHSQDKWVQAGDKFFENDEYPKAKPEQYYDVTIQVINLIKLDANGKDITPEAWKTPGNTTESAPLQLDLGKLTTQKRETPYMSSDNLLCEGIGYGTTKTYHDSIRVWGWRDNLAAWSELQESLTEASGDYEEYGKQFHIMGEHLLTRNIKRYHNEGMNDNLLLQEKELMIYGDDWNSNVLNVGGFNLISEVAKNQTLELRNLTVVNIGTGDKAEDTAHRTYSPDTIWQKTHNEGTYILDNLVVDADYAVVNDGVAIKRGSWGIYNIFTSYQRSEVDMRPEAWVKSYDAVAGTDAINNELHLQMDRDKHGTTYITGTIEYNNVHNDEGAETYLKVHEDIDYRRADGSTHFVDSSLYDQSAATGAFQRFYCNSLLMNDGNFYLQNLNYQELKLRDLNIKDGTIHINTTTVDLEKEEMGRIWAYHNAWYDGTGHIIVKGMDALVLKPKDGISDAAHYIERDGKRGYETPVRFANKGVAASVIPFGEEDDYADATHKRSKTYDHAKQGKLYWYEVDYCYEDVDVFKAGYYYYRRWLNDKGQSEFVPGVQVGPVAAAAGALGSMQQVQDHVFEHADLFADSVYSTQKDRLRNRDFTVVNPTKGKNAVAGSSVAKSGSSCGGEAGFKGGLWVRPYSGYEKQSLSGGPRVTNSLYGALVGGDTALTEHKNDWASVFSAHAAYMGSTQRYSQRGSHVRINQNGGGVGVTGTFYKKNFYTALSGTVATASGHANSSAGTEKFHMLLGGVASRSGYNIEFGRGRYVLQPTLLLSYTMVNMADYTNAAGARIASSPTHLLQVHPYVKFIMHTDSCWTPYLTLGYVHNFMGKTSYQADGVKLPEMSTDPYVEYSLGIQRTWYDKYTLFGQATGRHGGRNGAEVSVGFRWAW